MARERLVASGTRVDCLSIDFAIEVDWTENWAEAIGQVFHYTGETSREPGIVLVCYKRRRYAFSTRIGKRIQVEMISSPTEIIQAEHRPKPLPASRIFQLR